MVVEGPEFNNFFTYVEVANFEVASDAFTTFKVTSPSPPADICFRMLLWPLPAGACLLSHFSATDVYRFLLRD